VVVHVHGGGFASGDLDSHDRVCRRIARRANVVVVAVDHRRSPEHPGPAAIDDVVGVVQWVANRPEPLGPLIGPPALVGDSSGGAIAVLAAAIVARRPMALATLILVCPNADLTLAYPSIQAKGHGWGLEESALAWYVAQWAPNLDEGSLRQLSPLHSDLDGLPSTLVVTAEHDPLRDEGVALTRRLSAHGVDCTHLPVPGMVHGFWTLDDVSPAACRAGDTVIDRLAELLATGSDQ
jgi:acetyl esterase